MRIHKLSLELESETNCFLGDKGIHTYGDVINYFGYIPLLSLLLNNLELTLLSVNILGFFSVLSKVDCLNIFIVFYDQKS